MMPIASSTTTSVHRSPHVIEAVVIGASTGGPNALTRLLTSLPRDWQTPLLVVQHMPREFTRHMAERLAARTNLCVREGVHGASLRDAQVWIAPGDYHMSITRELADYRLCIHQDPPENSCRPSVDVLFRSAAAAFGPGLLGVILTGMGQDGLLGAESIRQAGGYILAQDQATSVIWGMPGAIVRAGFADDIVPIDEVGLHIVRRVNRSRGKSASGLFRPMVSDGDQGPHGSHASADSSLDVLLRVVKPRLAAKTLAEEVHIEKKETSEEPSGSRTKHTPTLLRRPHLNGETSPRWGGISPTSEDVTGSEGKE